VESLTSGELAHAVGAGENASEWFLGGIVAYMQDVKQAVLDVDAGTDPCSPECAEQLAVGGRELLSADVCVSTTGVGGPDVESGHPPGTVYLGWATTGASGNRLLELHGSPEEVMATTTTAAIDLIAATMRVADPR
jgi:nicotinamide-nucleotide amidase